MRFVFVYLRPRRSILGVRRIKSIRPPPCSPQRHGSGSKICAMLTNTMIGKAYYQLASHDPTRPSSFRGNLCRAEIPSEAWTTIQQKACPSIACRSCFRSVYSFPSAFSYTDGQQNVKCIGSSQILAHAYSPSASSYVSIVLKHTSSTLIRHMQLALPVRQRSFEPWQVSPFHCSRRRCTMRWELAGEIAY